MDEIRKVIETIKEQCEGLEYLADQLTIDNEAIFVHADKEGDVILVLHNGMAGVDSVTINLSEQVLEDYATYGISESDEDREYKIDCINRLADALRSLADGLTK